MPSDVLDYITIRGFKSIASLEKLPLRPINLVIGANGSGKSNFLGSFAFLTAVTAGRLRNSVAVAGGAEKVLHLGSKVTKELFFEYPFPQLGCYRLTLSPTEDDSLFPSEERIVSPDGSIIPLLPNDQGREAGISRSVGGHIELRADMAALQPYHFNDTSASSLIRKTANLDDNRFLHPDGSNLAAYLYWIQKSSLDSYESIRRTIQLAAPFFDDFYLEPRKLAPNTIRLQWRHKDSEQYFDASSLSDGTLRFICLVTLFLRPVQHRPLAILVDEPELGLHPHAIEILASLIRQASIDTQVIVSTQSPLLLDHFDPEDVLVADRVNGSTRITRLQAEPLAVWLKEYSLGQLWEKNEIGGRPGRG